MEPNAMLPQYPMMSEDPGGVPRELPAAEGDVLHDLLDECGVALPLVPEVAWDTAGVVVEDGHIVELGTYGLGLHALPESISRLKHLRVLNVTNNLLCALPEAACDLRLLEVLACANNRLSRLPESIGKLRQLRHINLSFNKLGRVPDSISGLVLLVTLNLDDNELIAVPPGLSALACLEELDLGVNAARTNRGGPYSAKHEAIVFSDAAQMPATVYALQAALLGLSCNQIECLPEDIGRLTSLRKLSMVSNRLRHLPGTIGELSRLVELNASYNELSSVPGSVANLASLERLDLRYNRIGRLPASLASMARLARLHVAGNPLDEGSLALLSSVQANGVTVG